MLNNVVVKNTGTYRIIGRNPSDDYSAGEQCAGVLFMDEIPARLSLLKKGNPDLFFYVVADVDVFDRPVVDGLARDLVKIA
jgi:hypothetical protein